MTSDRYEPGGNRHNQRASPPDSAPTESLNADIERRNPRPSYAIAEDTFFVRTPSALTAINTVDGTERWSQSRDSFGSLGYIAGRLYHSTRDYTEALLPDGDTIWHLESAAQEIGEMDQYVYTGTEESVGWLDSETGEEVGTSNVVGEPVLAWNDVIYSLSKTAIHAYSHEEAGLKQMWKKSIEKPFEIQGSWHLLSDETLYVRETAGAAEKRLGRYDIGDGSVRTSDRTYPHIESLVVRDGVEYLVYPVADESGEPKSWTLSARDGEVLWEHSFESRPTKPVIADGTVYLGGGNGELLALDAETGAKSWTVADRGGSIAVVDETIYVVRDSTLYALR